MFVLVRRIIVIKKLFSFLVVVMLVLSLLPTNATALDEVRKPEYAWFPATTMNITQISYESYSHWNQNAIDFLPAGDVVAPFTGTITYADSQWGYVVFQSSDKVRWADGSFDYMTVTLMHDEDISNLIEAKANGNVIQQGDVFYQAGGMGEGKPNAYGDHVHMAVYRGHVDATWGYGNGNEFVFNALYINPDITTEYVGSGKGVVYSGNSVNHDAPTDYRGLWKELDYLSKCTMISSLITIQITDRTTIKSFPCSKATCDESLDIRNAKKGETLDVTALYKNTAGNYWYEVDADGQTGYVFAGNATRISFMFDQINFYSEDGKRLWLNGELYDSPFKKMLLP